MNSAEEEVDGPQIAADILAKMEPGRRSRILAGMTKRSPELSKKVTQKLYSVSRLLQVAARELEDGLLRVSDEDIALALKGGKKEVCNHLFLHISPRRRQIVTELLSTLPPTSIKLVEAAQARILRALEGGIRAVG
jgi:flagellar motor switch protein FliG